MADQTDMELLREFADRHTESAFTALVERHIPLVYSVALRSVGNGPDAQDVTQAVFLILTRKIPQLRQRLTLTGWLYETTRLTARQCLRTRARRQARDQEVYMQSTPDAAGDPVWRQLAPHLETVMSRLNEKERTLLALRFYENKTGAEAAALLGIREAAAHKRTARALEKLRQLFLKRGVSSTAAMLAGAISANSVQAAPAGLALKISAVAVAKGAAAGTSTLTLVKGALKIMAWTKMKTAVVVGAGLILAAGTTTVVFKGIQKHETPSQPLGKFQWQVESYSSELLNQAPPLVEIVPTKFPNAGGYINDNGKTMGLGDGFIFILADAYGTRWTRMIISTPLPPGQYDFISSLPSRAMEGLQQKIKTKFNIVAKRVLLDTNVFLLSVKNSNADGLRPSTSQNVYEGNGMGHFVGTNQTLSALAEMVENMYRIPILDRTGLTNRYDFSLAWDQYGKKVGNQYPNYPNLSGLKQALLDQLGLELVPGREPIEMLVVEKMN